MQATSCFVQPFFPTKSATKDSPLTFTRSSLGVSRGVAIKAASVSFEPLAFNYNSPFSVFPVEACETIGGDACAANMFPEAKLDKQGGSVTNTKSFFEEVDREYFDYTSETKRVKLHTSDPPSRVGGNLLFGGTGVILC